MNGPGIQPIRKKAISDEIVDQLVDLIGRNELKPGERLPPERELCRQFGVGRTTLREALRSLATLGIGLSPFAISMKNRQFAGLMFMSAQSTKILRTASVKIRPRFLW